MKKLALIVAVAMALASCTKDYSCQCVTTSSETGMDYDYSMTFDSWGNPTYYQISTPFSSTSSGGLSVTDMEGTKKFVAAGTCPAKSESKDVFDYTYETGNTDASGNPIIAGSTGTVTYTTTCTLDKK